MDKLNRLGWAAGFGLRTFGVTIGVRVSSAAVLPDVVSLLPPGATIVDVPVVDHLFSLILPPPNARPGVRGFHLTYAGALQVARTLDLHAALEALESQIRMIVAARAPRRIFVHAGAVGWQGRAILLPGRSFAGKSTLVEALVRAGATYYSDEYAVLDEHGQVHPFAKPLSLRQPGQVRSTNHSVESLGGVPGETPLTVGLVVVTRYRKGAAWRPRKLSHGQAVLALLNNTVPARLAPERAMVALGRAVVSASALTGARGEAGEVAQLLLRRLEVERTPLAVQPIR